MMMNHKALIEEKLEKALKKAGYEVDSRSIVLEQPKQENFGDIATPVAMNLAKIAKKAPRLVAEEIVQNFEPDASVVEKIEIAGPGFINFYLAPLLLQQTIHDVLKQGAEFGKSEFGGGEKIQFEFVSANPTGPLNVVSARAASVGDVLANIYRTTGFDIKKEYYVNDAGRQIRLLGESLNARFLTEIGQETPIPEDGYHGDYLRDLARQMAESDAESLKSLPETERIPLFSEKALSYMLDQHRQSMHEFGVDFDVWFHESELRKNEEHLKVLQRLEQSGHTCEKDGAIWFKSTDYGDEKDRVLVTSKGRPTYFLVDGFSPRKQIF
ncbi:MAG: arginine--tRNA ligase [candidate division KSB1 bacterium]|nr:arginine--tRNA ligase [candidate division KSB1 bacterium]